MTMLPLYGGNNVSLDRRDIRDLPSLSVDLRAETGAPGRIVDESAILPPGAFTLSVCGWEAGEHPIGEIRMWYAPARREIRIVGHLTGRDGMTEITPDHMMAMEKDPEYRRSILEWLGVSDG